MSIKAKRIITAAVFVLAALTAIGIISIQKYTDKHTWATVAINGTSITDIADAYSETHEYLKNDLISIGTLTLRITDISHKGTVQFAVKNGTLKDADGDEITKDVLEDNVPKDYSAGSDHFSLCVVSHRYQ
ncbi:MAG: hypothetical protein J6S92_05595 [Oscillospiraceae bacterium]|nr:hypothetical protein [Oscillospiraceae bacterium]